MAENKPDLGERVTPSFLTGLYLFANAVSDCRVVVDGTDCVTRKAEMLYASHDLASTLLDCRGNSRVLHTSAHAREILRGSSAAMLAAAGTLRARADVGLVLLSSLPVMSMTGRDYARVAAEAAPGAARLVDVSANALDLDFLDGYALALKRTALDMPLKRARGSRKKVGVVGYFMDRNEGDHRGNLAELARLAARLGLELVSVWPGGGKYADLARIEEAGVIVSMPYGAEAARILAKKTGARLIEPGLPLGFAASAAWLKQVGAACGVPEKKISAVIAEELAASHALARMAVGSLLAGRRVCFTGDPHLAAAFCGFAEELGMLVGGLFLSCSKANAQALKGRLPGKPLLADFRLGEYADVLLGLFGSNSCELLVANSLGRRSVAGGLPGVEFGFPSYRHHVLAAAPFLGFKGAVNLVERLFNAARGL